MHERSQSQMGTKKTKRFKRRPLPVLVFLGVFAFIGVVNPTAVQADQLSVSLSNITFLGVNACSGICKEIFNSTFVWDTGFGGVVPGSISTSSTGPLGPFNTFSVTSSPLPGIPKFTWSESLPSTIQWIPSDNPPGWPHPGTYSASNVSLHCQLGSEVDPCADLFGFVSSIPASSGNITVTSAVPEPSTMILTASGILLLFSSHFLRRRRKTLGVLPRHSGFCSSSLR